MNNVPKQMMQDFECVPDHFEPLFIKRFMLMLSHSNQAIIQF